MSQASDDTQRFEDVPEEVPRATWSLAMYGITMDAAQFLEYKLAVLYGVIEMKALSRRRRNPDKTMERAFKRVEHAFQKASASELRRLLEGKVDDGMLDKVARSSSSATVSHIATSASNTCFPCRSTASACTKSWRP